MVVYMRSMTYQTIRIFGARHIKPSCALSSLRLQWTRAQLTDQTSYFVVFRTVNTPAHENHSLHERLSNTLLFYLLCNKKLVSVIRFHCLQFTRLVSSQYLPTVVYFGFHWKGICTALYVDVRVGINIQYLNVLFVFILFIAYDVLVVFSAFENYPSLHRSVHLQLFDFVC